MASNLRSKDGGGGERVFYLFVYDALCSLKDRLEKKGDFKNKNKKTNNLRNRRHAPHEGHTSHIEIHMGRFQNPPPQKFFFVFFMI